MLMIGREATTEDIRGAFLRAAKVWHPDTLPPSISEVRSDCERVFQRIALAYETLVDPRKRRDYERSIGDALRENAEADHLLSQAEMHLTLGDRLQAEGLARKALGRLAGAPGGDGAARVPGGDRPAPRAERAPPGVAQDDRHGHREGPDVQASPLLPRRDQEARSRGNHEGAIRDLRVAVTNDPDDVDAQRELRLYEKKLRDGTIQIRSLSPSGGIKKPEGFFDRLRKK